MKARTAAANQMHIITDTAPEPIRAQLRALTTRQRAVTASRYRAGDVLTPTGAAKRALIAVGRRWLALTDEIAELDRAIKTIPDTIAAPLLERHGIGYETAATLLIAAGDNPERIGSESSFAAFCGSSPVPVSSGKTNWHRLNLAGDRHANSALWTIAMVLVRANTNPPSHTSNDAPPTSSQNASSSACIKRYIAREIYNDIRTITNTNTARDTHEIAA